MFRINVLCFSAKRREKHRLINSLNSDDVDRDYLRHIKLDGSPESYFQLIILLSLASQFALFWHAAYYDSEILCTPKAVEKLLGRRNPDYADMFTDQEKVEKAKNLNVEPEIEIKEDIVKVRLVYFTKWGGFYEKRYQIKKDFPHLIIDKEEENILYFDCGFKY